jgi:hypothetical protein
MSTKPPSIRRKAKAKALRFAKKTPLGKHVKVPKLTPEEALRNAAETVWPGIIP